MLYLQWFVVSCFEMTSCVGFSFLHSWKRTTRKTIQRIACHWNLNQRALIISYSTSQHQGKIKSCVFLAVYFSSLFKSIDSLTYIFIVGFSVQKMPQTAQTAEQNLYLGRICLNEFWWVLIFNMAEKLVMIECWTCSNARLCCVFRVPRRVSLQMRKIKRLQLPLL